MRVRPLAALLLLGATGCTRTVYEAHFATPAQLAKIAEAGTRSPFLKCHMPDGRVFVLEHWSIDEGAGTAQGWGLEYAASRARIGDPRQITLGLRDIALLETDRPYSVDVGAGSIVGMAIGSTASIALTVVCAMNPGACF